MKYFFILCLSLCAVHSSAQKTYDFVELTDGDTIIGNVWGVEPTQLRFQAKGQENTTLIALQMVESYSFYGEIRQPDRTMQIKESLIGQQFPEEEKLHIAGLKLQKSANLFYTGAAITVIGAAGSIVGSVIAKENPQVGSTVSYVGAGLAVVGALVSLSAFIPISEAGIQLQKIKLGK